MTIKFIFETGNEINLSGNTREEIFEEFLTTEHKYRPFRILEIRDENSEWADVTRNFYSIVRA